MADAKPDEDNVEMHEPNEPNELKLSYEDERLANIKYALLRISTPHSSSFLIPPSPRAHLTHRPSLSSHFHP